ncbi:hypothetical protein M231_01409 [Tremella mesenterica]|uniref:Uncharacterized protein n=1 Tax=Tremella mesenterica TaxID=5217 RepID=A0A4Q1BT69_TREME|nr:hypothetical protein M231_01409 [Tremella mesenterica]
MEPNHTSTNPSRSTVKDGDSGNQQESIYNILLKRTPIAASTTNLACDSLSFVVSSLQAPTDVTEAIQSIKTPTRKLLDLPLHLRDTNTFWSAELEYFLPGWSEPAPGSTIDRALEAEAFEADDYQSVGFLNTPSSVYTNTRTIQDWLNDKWVEENIKKEEDYTHVTWVDKDIHEMNSRLLSRADRNLKAIRTAWEPPHLLRHLPPDFEQAVMLDAEAVYDGAEWYSIVNTLKSENDHQRKAIEALNSRLKSITGVSKREHDDYQIS